MRREAVTVTVIVTVALGLDQESTDTVTVIVILFFERMVTDTVEVKVTVSLFFGSEI